MNDENVTAAPVIDTDNVAPEKPAQLTYRPDIDGLRALAVLAVVAYHYFPGQLPGGFVGVDVFFVISGYLITGILAKDFAAHTFSLLYFYERRIRRIFPALILVLSLCLIVGWFLLFPIEYEALGKHVAAGAGYVQNFALWAEAGYFDSEAIQKPLLHLWSLAVEEQFYIFWPLILWFVMRRRWPVLASITVIAGVSFALNVWSVSSDHSSTAFFWPTARAWELMIGAWLAMSHCSGPAWLGRWKALQSTLGLTLILVGFAVIRHWNFPGFWALLPTLGAALVINAGPNPLLNRRLLSWKPAVWIGLISYPLYLWHWVLYSLTIVVVGELDTWHSRELKVALFATSILLSWLTYRCFEQPVRRHGEGRVTLGLFLAVGLLGLGGVVVWLSNGVPTRPMALYNVGAQSYAASIVRSPLVSKCSDLVARGKLDRQWTCTLGSTAAKTWILAYGDSHAESLIPPLDRYGREAGIRIVYASLSGCLALQGIYDENPNNVGPNCEDLAKRAVNLAVKQHPAAVVLIQSWVEYTDSKVLPGKVGLIHVIDNGGGAEKSTRGVTAFKYGLDKTMHAYHVAGVPVVLMEDNPQQPGWLSLSRLRFHLGPKDFEGYVNVDSVTLAQHQRYQAEINRILEASAARFSNVSAVNIDAALCNDTICPWTSGGKFLYFNASHLSITGAVRVYPILAQHLNQVLGLDAPVPPVQTP
ncbi:MAG: acyltransferase family protein [Rhodanobacter sp.]